MHARSRAGVGGGAVEQVILSGAIPAFLKDGSGYGSGYGDGSGYGSG